MMSNEKTVDHRPLSHREYPPSEYLRPFVRRFLHSYGPRATSVAVPPTGAHYITHPFGAPMAMRFSGVYWDECPALFVGGQLKDEMPVAEVAEKGELLGVEFRPTGFYRLFQTDCDAFTDCITDLRRIDPDGAAVLVEALSRETDITGKIDHFERFLARLVPDAVETPEVDRAVATIERHDGCLRVDDLARECGWSPRRLYRYFLKTIGIGPKHFAKIVQINRVAMEIQARNEEGLQHIAARCGYYDQAHFIRDFQRLIGTNPAAFLRHPDPFLATYLGRVGSRSP